MWVNSKTAAAVLSVGDRAIQKAVLKAITIGKNFCVVKSNKINFTYLNGIGRGGKVLQIWIDDSVIANFENKRSSDTHEVRGGFLAEQSEAEQSQNGVRVSINGIIQGSKCADLHGIWGEIPQESQNLVNSPRASFNNGSLNTGDCFVSCDTRNDNNSSLDSSPCVRKAQNDGLENLGGCSVSAGSFGSVISGATNEVSKIEPFVHVKKFLDTSATSEAECSNLLSSKKSTASQTQPSAVGGCEKTQSLGAGNCETTSLQPDGVVISAASSVAVLTFGNATQKQKDKALIKKAILDEWEANKKGLLVLDSSLWAKAQNDILSVAEFIAYINAKKIYGINLTKNKLFAWLRAYKISGIDGLMDGRGNDRVGLIEKLGLAELVNSLIRSQKGRVNVFQIHKVLNYHIATEYHKYHLIAQKLNLLDFLGKRDEAISYDAVRRYSEKYLKNNRITREIIKKGDDSAVSKFLPAVGNAAWAVESINEVVQIDGTSLDIVANASSLAKTIGFESVSSLFRDEDEFIKFISEWQKRYTLIGLIDEYSGVSSFYVCESENQIAVVRAVYKYACRYGMPRTIKGDNGKAFLAKIPQHFFASVGIKYEAVAPYSGWKKPFVEKNFGSLQNALSEHLKGYIGHNITERQAIEFFFNKKERRLKRGQKSNLKDLMNAEEIGRLIDNYTEKFLNNRYLERLGASPREIYESKIADVVVADRQKMQMYLAEPQNRYVGKKGISYNGHIFFNARIFEYEEVVVRENLDNLKELFAWSLDGEFIGVLSLVDPSVGVSVEQAAAVQKVVKRKIKLSKEKIADDRAAHEAYMSEFYANADLPCVAQVAGSDLVENLANTAILETIEKDRNARENGKFEYYEKASSQYCQGEKSGVKSFFECVTGEKE